ncbi:LuxR C-terminal-related transcriptional regulator [Streptomyces sp. NPDC091376]|uniref:helix-turn-helix transcriptional regulator n=1 Tax=Streptomyces sp. NPDC091376 TaxID=3365994 RepID=UPI0037F2533B
MFREVLADSTSHSFLIEGPQGAGKTRLGEECLAAAQVEGYLTWRTVTTPQTTFPLAALAHVLPKDFDLQRPLESFQGIIAHLHKGHRGSKSGSGWIAVLVDDINLLDDASATVLEQLTTSGIAFMIASVEDHRETSESVSRLIYQDSARRTELAYLDQQEVEALLSATLEGLVGPRAADYFFHVSEGNILYLRELVIGAVQAGNLTFDGEMWEISGHHKPTPHLSELVWKRVESAGAEGREFLETLALCGTSGIGPYQSEVPSLESAGLIRITRRGRRTMADLAHPVYGEVLRTFVSSTRKSMLLLAQAERIRAAGARRQEDFRYIAQWELFASGEVDASTLLKGSRLARRSFDYEQVKVLTEAACRVDEGFWPRLLLGEALYELGEADRAVEVLKIAATRAQREDEHVYASLALERVLCWALAAPEEALRINAEAAQRATTPEARATLDVAQGVFLTFTGRMRDALDHLKEVENIPNAHIRAVGQGTLATVLTFQGRVDEGLAIAHHAYEERKQLIDPPALLHPSENIPPVACAIQESGSLSQAYMMMLKGWDEANTDNDLEGLTMMASALARAALLEGRPRTARRWASQAVSLARHQGFLGPLHPALSRLAEASAMVQDRPAARRALQETRGMTPWGTFTPELCLGHVWLSATSGDLAHARELLTEASSRAQSMGHVSSEARLLTDLCRLGGEHQAYERLKHLAQISSGKFTAIRSRFAEALHLQDPEMLMDTAHELKEAGALLLSAEAAAAAAENWQRKGNTRQSMASLRMMNSLLGQCEGAWTPLIASTAAETPLTARELEISLLVAEGDTNAEVAQKLFLSKRTVDNHLLSIFRKLGVTNRRELKKALAR